MMGTAAQADIVTASRVAIVTGADTQLGRALAARLARDGAIVVATYRDDTTSLLPFDAGGAAVQLRPLDVRDEAAWTELVRSVVDTFRRLHVLVNAERELPSEPLGRLDPAAFDAAYRRTVGGAWLGARTCVAAIQQSGGGAIINLTGMPAEHGSPGAACAAMFSAALRSLSKSLAVGFATGTGPIRPNSVDVGALWCEDPAALVGGQPDPSRGADLEAAGAAVSFLASDRASYCFGARITIGGYER